MSFRCGRAGFVQGNAVVAAATVGLTVAVLLAAAAMAVNPPVVSTAADRTGIDVTVYNHDLALVREVRRVDLPEGRFSLEFRDVPARIRPATLLVTGPNDFRLLEQNYEFDLMSREKILEKYVGRPVSWIQADSSRVEGVLLGLSNGPVYRVAGEIVFEVPGRLALPDLPQNLRARPTLVWLADVAVAGDGTVEASYLTLGLSWQADYVLQLDGEGERADLQAWVTVENRSGAAYEEARLLLVAGDVNQVRPTPDKMRHMELMRAASHDEDAFASEVLYDYHLYTLQRPATLLENQIKQVSLFEVQGVGVSRKYRLGGRPHFYRGVGPLRDDTGIGVSYTLENSENNRLGVALPAGVVRLYGRSDSGARQLLGEDRIRHTPRDESVELTVGRAFDLVAERVRTDSRKLASNLVRHDFEITLRNHKDEDVSIEVVEPIGGYWEITAASQQHRKLDASTVAFDVAVPADGETVLTYTVEVRN